MLHYHIFNHHTICGAYMRLNPPDIPSRKGVLFEMGSEINRKIKEERKGTIHIYGSWVYTYMDPGPFVSRRNPSSAGRTRAISYVRAAE